MKWLSVAAAIAIGVGCGKSSSKPPDEVSGDSCAERVTAIEAYHETLRKDGTGPGYMGLPPRKDQPPQIANKVGHKPKRAPALLLSSFDIAIAGAESIPLMDFMTSQAELMEQLRRAAGAGNKLDAVMLLASRDTPWQAIETLTLALLREGVGAVHFSLLTPSALEPPAKAPTIKAYVDKRRATHPMPPDVGPDDPYNQAWSRCAKAGDKIAGLYLTGPRGKTTDEVLAEWKTQMGLCKCAFDDEWVKGYLWLMNGRIENNVVGTLATVKIDMNGRKLTAPADAPLSKVAEQLAAAARAGETVLLVRE